MAKKMTKKEMFAKLKAISAVAENADMVAFIDHEIELLERKNASGEKKLTKTQEGFTAIESAIVEAMDEGVAYTATEVGKMVGGLTTQKVTPRLRALTVEGKITKTEVKGRMFYSLA